MNIHKVLVIESCEYPISYKKTKTSSDVNAYCPNYTEFMDIAGKDIDDIYSVDSRGCISIIDSENNEISLGNYKSESDIRFFKISDDLLKQYNAEFYVSTDFLYGKKKIDQHKWSSDIVLCMPEDKLPGYTHTIAYQDLIKMVDDQFDGYSICELILNSKSNVFPVQYCKEIIIDNNGMQYYGFLPSVYQLRVLTQYLCVIDDFNKRFNVTETDGIYLYQNTDLWTCNEFSSLEAWFINGMEHYKDKAVKKFYTGYKLYKKGIFPVFKKINVFK